MSKLNIETVKEDLMDLVADSIITVEEYDKTAMRVYEYFEPLLTYVNRHGKVLEHVAQERLNQTAKFGDQSHLPSLDPVLTGRPGGCTPARMAEEYEMPTEARAKQLLATALERGQLTFAHIALEEFAEVIAAPTDVLRYGELIQLAAVCVQWAEAIKNGEGRP